MSAFDDLISKSKDCCEKKKAMGPAPVPSSGSPTARFTPAKQQGVTQARAKASAIRANSPTAGFGKGIEDQKRASRDTAKRGWNPNKASASDASIRHNTVGKWGQAKSKESTDSRKQAIKDTFAGKKPTIKTDNGRGMGVNYGDQLSVRGLNKQAKPLPKSMFHYVDLEKATPAFDMDAFNRDNPVFDGDSNSVSLGDYQSNKMKTKLPKGKKAPSADAAANKMKSAAKKGLGGLMDLAKATPAFDMDAFNRDNPVFDGDSNSVSLGEYQSNKMKTKLPKGKKAPNMDSQASKMKSCSKKK